MAGDPESPQSKMTYREARRAFIAACEKAHVETVARLHPSKGPDGKPLFMDCAAMGARRAAKAVLIVGYDAPGSAMLIALLSETLPPDAKLVLVHALDPAAFAGVKGDPAWPPAALQAEVTEDLLHVRHLAVLPLGRRDERLIPALRAQLPNAALIALPQAASAAKARAAIGTFFTTH
jgi:hypothetical protein